MTSDKKLIEKIKSSPRKQAVKKGSREWWNIIAICEAVDTRRMSLGIAKNEEVVIDIDLVNRVIDDLNKNPLKRLWLYLINSEIKTLDVGEIGIQADNGDVIHMRKKKKARAKS